MKNGTEKQIQWAEQIKERQMPVIDTTVANLLKEFAPEYSGYDDTELSEMTQWLNEWVEIVKSQDDAIYWIDRNNVELSGWKTRFYDYVDYRMEGKTFQDIKPILGKYLCI